MHPFLSRQGLFPLRSRLAPTPSGLLHVGNGVNCVLTWLVVRHHGGSLRLRIDDVDCARSRPAYVEDIFRQLDWLGLDWDEGPQGPGEFFTRFSQRLKRERYLALRDELVRRELLYCCTCSRRHIRDQVNDGLYPGTCRGRRTPPAEAHAWRVRLPQDSRIRVGAQEVDVSRAMGDFVVWRRDGLPAYQLASLADDIDDRITLVVRGEDLLPSTAAQLLLAAQLEERGFLAAEFLHHPLLSCPQGNKLSKSHGALSLAAMRISGAGPAVVYRETARLLGLPPECGDSLTDLQAAAFPPRVCAPVPESCLCAGTS
ncbi:MAG: hypothetical protein BWK76_19295 [Desulfobulbaceae bacterium A2]|nr:MAG: hypothetical protein BWK76_19295 [Desulfobulbaceae bacterium A2]